MLLSEGRLQAIRDRWEANMPERVTVLPLRQMENRPSEVEEAYPEPDEDGLTVYACRSQPGSAPAVLPVGMEATAVRWFELALPVDAVIPASCRLYHEGPGGTLGFTWNRTLNVLPPEGPRTWQARQLVTGWEAVAADAEVL